MDLLEKFSLVTSTLRSSKNTAKLVGIIDNIFTPQEPKRDTKPSHDTNQYSPGSSPGSATYEPHSHSSPKGQKEPAWGMVISPLVEYETLITSVRACCCRIFMCITEYIQCKCVPRDRGPSFSLDNIEKQMDSQGVITMSEDHLRTFVFKLVGVRTCKDT